ncbi:MAG: type II toxin-antitoxin system VapB family antitoxin [Gammaproteobacteria bacterium]
MRTNIVIDDDLMDEAISLTGIHTKRELVNLALKELVQNRKKKDLFKLAGQIEFREDFVKPTQKNKCLFQAIQQWRSQLDEDSALAEAELKQLRSAGQERKFSWDD